MPWYQGPPLLYHLEHVHIASDRNLIDVRFPVQWVIRPPAEQRRRLPRLRRARSPAGCSAPGDEVVVLPGGQHTTDRRDRHLRRAASRRRSRRCRSRSGWPTTSTSGAAARSCARRTSRPSPPASSACCAGCPSSRSSPRRRYLVKHTTRTAMVGGVDVRYRIDVESLRRDEDVDHARAERSRARAPASSARRWCSTPTGATASRAA